MPGQSAEPVRPRVLVTGAAGFLGLPVVEMLSAAGLHDVVATDIVESGSSRHLARLPHVEFRQMDLLDSVALAASVSGVNAIIHLAAVRTKSAASRPRDAVDLNVGVTFELATHAVAHGVPRIVYGSSQAVYGSFPDPDMPRLGEEDAIVRPGLSVYGASKLASEAFLQAVIGGGETSYVALRLGTLYGPRISRDSNNGTLIDVLEAMNAGTRPQVPWATTSLHTMTYVSDAAEAVVRALDAPPECTAINVVGEPVSADEVYTTLVRLYGGDPSTIEWRDDRTRYQLVSRTRMRDVLGFEPRVSLADGLLSFIEWYRSDARRTA